MKTLVERTRELASADSAVIELAEGEWMLYRARSGTAALRLQEVGTGAVSRSSP
jgi:hypothetical protein